MFDQVDDQKPQGAPWGVIGGIMAMGALLVAGYFLIT